jgi:hypothetical protein
LTEEKTSADDDASLKMLNARKLIELRRRANTVAKQKEEVEKAAKAKPPPSDREIVTNALIERGDEVLATAEASYPREMAILIPRLAGIIRQGKIKTVTGGELLQFLRAIGLRVSVPTSISVEEHGKFVSLSDKLKSE